MTGQARRSGWFAADSAAGANGSCDWTPQAPPSDLPGKLTLETYGVHFYVRPPHVRAEALVARDQSRSSELWEQPGSRNSFQVDPDQAGAAAAISALSTSASPEARPVSHETRDAVEHVGQACLELLLPLILGEAGRQAVHRRETPGSAQCRAPIASMSAPRPPASSIGRPGKPRAQRAYSPDL
jgi:hypothetical protein